jgi:hypothetical protein
MADLSFFSDCSNQSNAPLQSPFCRQPRRWEARGETQLRWIDKVAVRKTTPTFPPRLLITQRLVKEAEPTRVRPAVTTNTTGSKAVARKQKWRKLG